METNLIQILIQAPTLSAKQDLLKQQMNFQCYCNAVFCPDKC